MSNPTRKRGFVPPQPAAALSALDFAAAIQALRMAHLASNVAKSDDEVAQAADLVARRADALLSIPTNEAGHVAEKVSAFGWLHNITPGPLADLLTQDRVATSSDDRAKGLLAIYLDLATAPAAALADRSVWDAVLAEADAAWAEVEAANMNPPDDDDPAEGKAWERHGLALEALLNTRAPDAPAMAHKARHIIARNHADWRDDSPGNPATIARLLGGSWDEHFIASIYQDGLTVAGDAGPLATVAPDPFDATDWLILQKREHGEGLFVAEYGGEVEGGPKAMAALEALPLWKAAEVNTALDNEARLARQEEDRARLRDRPELTKIEVREIFATTAANTFPEAERESVLAKVREALGLIGGGQ